MRGDQTLNRPEDLVLVKNDPSYNEMWPRAVVPYQQIYGVAAPVNLPELANEGQTDSRLPEGTPLALIGTSSLISRDTRPFRGDRFYQHENFGDRNWTRQGADSGLYNNSDIYAVRILALQPVTDRSYPNNGRAFESHFSERVRILGEIPVRKEGVNDTVSFEVRENLTATPRSTTLMIAGQTVAIIQDGGLGDNCAYSIAPKTATVSRSGGSGSLAVTCEQRCAWQATSNAGWITITSSGMGIGNGAVSFSVTANATGSSRTGTITVAGKVFKVKQK
jgi:hypothetical protein